MERMTPRLLIVIGTRPQFIKYGALARAFEDWSRPPETVDTGQHYDYALASGFLDEFGLSPPSHRLELKGESPLSQFGNMVSDLGEILEASSPDMLLCMGDTNSTLAAALAAVKLEIPVAHIEAGERNFDAEQRRIHPSAMPEEANRIMTDSISHLLCCASKRAVENLQAEGAAGQVSFTGDLMYDLFLVRRPVAMEGSDDLLQRLSLDPGGYYLATVHRALNTDDPLRLQAIFTALEALDAPVVVPLHPRTRKMLTHFGFERFLSADGNLRVSEPVSHGEAIALSARSKCVLTDSGGLVREAYLNGVPAVILDDTTAWIDLVLTGWATLAGADRDRIVAGARQSPPPERPELFGDGRAAHHIVKAVKEWLNA